MPGRKPTPPYLKLLRGNPGRRPIRPGLAVDRPTETPEPLPFLSPLAAEEWRRLAPSLTRLGVLSFLDHGPFGAYCEAYAAWRSAVEALDRMRARDPQMSGLLVKGDAGNPVVNPLVRIARQSADSMLRVAAEFGFTPAARSRIAAGIGGFSQPAASKFAGLLVGDDPA
jgi:P27 family predicted phage terminase small subunit